MIAHSGSYTWEQHHVYFKATEREDYKWYLHIQLIDTQGDGDPKYPDFIITNYMHVTNTHIHPINHRLLHSNEREKREYTHTQK